MKKDFLQIVAELRNYLYETTNVYTSNDDIMHSLGNVIALQREIIRAKTHTFRIENLAKIMTFGEVKKLLNYQPVRQPLFLTTFQCS